MAVWHSVTPRTPRRHTAIRRPPPLSNHDRWMVSYADFVTLLFAFFTMMYAISKVDIAKLNSMVGSMQKAFVNQAMPAAPRPVGVTSDQAPTASARGPADTNLQEQLEERLSKELQDGRVSLEVDARGVVISMFESGSFAVGSADLTVGARDVLSTIAGTIVDLDETVRVEGHTDDVPIRTPRFASNWDLSAARALNVVQYLISTAGLAPSRLSVSGYGEFHPRVPNDSPENRARNRRVDLVVLRADKRASEEPTSSSPARAENPGGTRR